MTAVIAAAAPHRADAGFLATLARIFALAPAVVEDAFPAAIPEGQAAAQASAVAAENQSPAGVEAAGGSVLSVLHEDALVAPLNPTGTLTSAERRSSDQIFLYTVRPGDTIAAIAKSFDVSVNTIRWANNIADTRSLKAGDPLLILPVSGVRHEVRKGDTVTAIAKRYRANIDDILQFNGLAPDEELTIGEVVIVPDGEIPAAAPIGSGPRSLAVLPAYDGFYLRPIIGGRRSRGLHGFNGIDLANACGSPVMAAAGGEVLVVRSSGWNGGYGRYVVIAHPNNTQTLYAHLRDVTMSPNGAVRRGETIGTIGSSGNSTGCHVHVEVRGARNPF